MHRTRRTLSFIYWYSQCKSGARLVESVSHIASALWCIGLFRYADKVLQSQFMPESVLAGAEDTDTCIPSRYTFYVFVMFILCQFYVKRLRVILGIYKGIYKLLLLLLLCIIKNSLQYTHLYYSHAWLKPHLRIQITQSLI